MSISIFFRTLWGSHCVGEDAQGNRYFEGKKVARYGKPRRWVVYKGEAEPTKVPAEWHGWLHYIIAEPPSFRQAYAWEKPHQPNLTGTAYAHRPKSRHGIAPKKDYAPWTPEGNN